MSESMSEQAAEIAALTAGVNRLKAQRDEAREALVVRERVLKARIAERDAALGAVAALADEWEVGDLGYPARASEFVKDLRDRLAPMSGAVAKHEQEVRAAALREAAEKLLANQSWDKLSIVRKFQVAATHGAAQRFSPEQIAAWLRARADALTEGPTETVTYDSFGAPIVRMGGEGA